MDGGSSSFHERPYCSAAHVDGSYLNCGAAVAMLKCLSHLTKKNPVCFLTKGGKNAGQIGIPEDFIGSGVLCTCSGPGIFNTLISA